MQKNSALAKFNSIVTAISARDCIALCHDLDADGICSGAITYNAIRLLRGRAPDLVITQPFKTVELLPKSLEMLSAHKITKLVIVDFALEQHSSSLEAAGNIVESILEIDHHKYYGRPKPGKIFIIKPQDFSKIEPSRYPAAKLAYDLFSRHVNIEGVSWVACVGLLGDCQEKQWSQFLSEAAKRHKTTLVELQKVVGIISAVEVLEPQMLQELLLLIADSKLPKEIIKSKFSKYAAKLGKKVGALLKEFEEKKEVFEKEGLIWFEFGARNNIKSAVINEVSHNRYPDRTVIFVQDKGDGFVGFSCRNQGFRVKTNELLENAVKGFENAGAGGHVPASAGRIMKKDLPEFKRRVLEFLRSGKFSQK